MSDINNAKTYVQWSEDDRYNMVNPPDRPFYGVPVSGGCNELSVMGAVKRFWDRINGTVTTTGSGSHYIYSPENSSYPTAYVQGEAYTFKANFSSAGGDDLNINGLGALPLYKIGPSGLTKIAADDIQLGQMISVQYDAALNSGAGGFQIMSILGNNGPTFVGTPSLLINPFFEIAQESASGAATVGTNIHTVDGWDMLASGAAVTWAQTGRVVTGERGNNSLTITGASGNVSVELRQKIRQLGCQSFYGQTAFSFLVLNNTGARVVPTFQVYSCSSVNSFSSVTQVFSQSLQACENGVVTKVWLTADLSQLSNITNGLMIGLAFPSVTEGNVVVADAQANAGWTPMPLVSRGAEEEFNRCQARYFLFSGQPAANRAIGIAAVVNTGEIHTVIQFPVQMEVIPTLSISSISDFIFDYGVHPVNMSFVDADTKGGILYSNGMSGVTIGNAHKLRCNGVSTARMVFDSRP